jgi:4-amino-4-deoxy-L-arabinose transferase-like glycosyltransferase
MSEHDEALPAVTESTRAAACCVAALAIGAAALVLIGTRHGPGIEPDSTSYISAARNLASGRGYRDFTGQPLTHFPPGFPTPLAVGAWLGISPTTAARLVNAVSLATIVSLGWLLARRHARALLVTLGATVLIAFSFGLVHFADGVLSETMFVAVTVAFLLALENAVTYQAKRGVAWSAVAGVAIGFAFAIRYAAFALFLAGVIALVVSWWGARKPRLIARVAAFVAAASLMPLAWLAWSASNGVGSKRFTPTTSTHESLVTFLKTLLENAGSLFLPQSAPSSLSGAFFVLLLGVASLGVWFARRESSMRRGPDTPWTLVPLVSFVVVYALFVVATHRVVGTSWDARLWSPIYVPAVILLARFADDVVARVTRTVQARRGRALVAGACACLAILALAVTYTAWDEGRGPRGLASRSVSRSELAREVRRLPSDSLIATNNPHGLYYATGHQPIVFSPGDLVPGMNPIPASLSSLRRHARCAGPVYVAWFNESLNHLEAPARLARRATLEAVRRLRDGTLYRVEASDSEPCKAS